MVVHRVHISLFVLRLLVFDGTIADHPYREHSTTQRGGGGVSRI